MSTETPTETLAALPFELSRVQQTLEEVWEELRARHPELPPVVILIGLGAEGQGKRLTKLGHWWPSRWRVLEGKSAEVRSELMLAGEALRDGAAEVLHVLLHEAAHALAEKRHIKDHSRGGRYHNGAYVKLAAEMGLTCTPHKTFGVVTVLPPTTVEAYEAELTMLSLAISAWRRRPGEAADGSTPPATDRQEGDRQEGGGKGGERRSKRVILVCACPHPRRLHMAPSQAILGAMTCGCCMSEFVPADLASTKILEEARTAQAQIAPDEDEDEG